MWDPREELSQVPMLTFNGSARSLSAIAQPMGTSGMRLILVVRLGRRKLFLAAALMAFVYMAVLTGTAGKPSLGPLSLTFMLVYAVSYAIGCLGLPFLYASETAPIHPQVPISAVSVPGQ